MSADQQFTPEDARQLVRDAVERGLDAAYERVRTNRVATAYEVIDQAAEQVVQIASYRDHLENMAGPDLQEAWVERAAEISGDPTLIHDGDDVAGRDVAAATQRAEHAAVELSEGNRPEVLAAVTTYAEAPWARMDGTWLDRETVEGYLNGELKAEGLPTLDEAQAHPEALWQERTNRSHNLTPWPQRNLATDTEPEVLYEELVPGVQDRQTALVVEQIGDEYQVYSQEMLQERPGTYLPGKTGDVAQFVTLAEADAYFAQLKEELTGTPHPAGGVVAPQELGLYTLPSIEGAGITTSEARQLNEAAAEAMSDHRPQADQLPSHRQGKFWDVVVEIDDYEHVRMIRDGVLCQSPGSWSTRVDFDELGARGHRTVSDYLAAERSYLEQIDHALDYVQRGAADGADPSDVAHIGRAAIGLDKAMLAADYDGDPQGPVTPGEWMSLYEDLDNQAQRASVQQQAALEQMTQQMPVQPGPDIR